MGKMKKIGFIDFFIDEWHANNYPKMIRESSFKGKFDVALAWDDVRREGKKPLAEWCAEQKVGQAKSQCAARNHDNGKDHEKRFCEAGCFLDR